MFFQCNKLPSWLKWSVNIFILIAILIITIFLYRHTAPAQFNNLDAFAKCLTQKEAVFYGTDWCQGCQDQKKIFGSSFQNINYVNCDFNTELCRNSKILKYPTWYVKGEKQMEGIISLHRLALLTGCEYK